MPNCAPGCKNRSTTGLVDGKNNEKLLPKELFICSGHFEPECFKRDLKVRFDFF